MRGPRHRNGHSVSSRGLHEPGTSAAHGFLSKSHFAGFFVREKWTILTASSCSFRRRPSARRFPGFRPAFSAYGSRLGSSLQGSSQSADSAVNLQRSCWLLEKDAEVRQQISRSMTSRSVRSTGPGWRPLGDAALASCADY